MSETRRVLVPTTVRTSLDGAECIKHCGGFTTNSFLPYCEFFNRYLSINFTDPADRSTYSITRCRECVASQEVQ